MCDIANGVTDDVYFHAIISLICRRNRVRVLSALYCEKA